MYLGNEGSAVPESYQPLISVCFGIWGWVVVLSILRWQHIDVHLLLYVSQCKIQPLIYLAASLSLLTSTYIYMLEHTKYTRTSELHHFNPVACCYLLAAVLIIFDIMISFSGILTGIFVKLTENMAISYSCFVPLITSLPYLIRLKQCLSLYHGSSSNNKRQLVNAFKYISAIPVIFLAHSTKLDNHNPDPYGDLLWRLWLFSAMFSNVFAFVWDIVMDWGIIQVGTDRVCIRKDLHFSEPWSYVLAVGINASIRLLKFGSHLHHIHPFCVDLAEIARRWTWVIFRFENEWIKRYYSEPINNL
ncbi:hypothetical protein INT47_007646 [Mucor saturninus]|uniref:EXS domain-containing protein n=1 Tax=Mucor saturninus TaxID=64648 RepID=A0A8H7VA63_9FUNG|nr:hypothetical protein INT47_007646 [Mucor saturninus]